MTEPVDNAVEKNSFLTEMDEALTSDDYGDGDYGRNITAGDLWILANAPDHIRELSSKLDVAHTIAEIRYGEGWEWGACAMLQKMEDDGKITKDEHTAYVRDNWL